MVFWDHFTAHVPALMLAVDLQIFILCKAGLNISSISFNQIPLLGLCPYYNDPRFFIALQTCEFHQYREFLLVIACHCFYANSCGNHGAARNLLLWVGSIQSGCVCGDMYTVAKYIHITNIQKETTEYYAPRESRACSGSFWKALSWEGRERRFICKDLICLQSTWSNTPTATYSEMKHRVDQKKDISIASNVAWIQDTFTMQIVQYMPPTTTLPLLHIDLLYIRTCNQIHFVLV